MPEDKDAMPVRALCPWFGAGRLIAPLVAQELAGCKFVAVPFCGGMSEIAEIDARSIAVNDLHRHVINLARVVADDAMRRELIKRLARVPFHPEILFESQTWCKDNAPECMDHGDPIAAYHYFVCSWMGRSHKAGCRDEFNGGLSTRWNANGGDSNTRYRSAVRGLVEWGRIMRRCSFNCIDAFGFLQSCPDTPETGIYVDAPWPDDGAKYRHGFSEAEQRRLAATLAEFKRARVVVRFGDHPLIRELYPEPDATRVGWTWIPVEGRTQTNQTKREVLIVSGPSRAGGGLFDGR
jgi:site-specific DNA-adenine methylase